MSDYISTDNSGSLWIADTGTVTATTSTTLSGTGTELKIYAGSGGGEGEGKEPVTRKEISAKLYFKFVNSKLTKLQVKNLSKRISKLKELADDAELIGQQALYEDLTRRMALAIREQEVCLLGYDRFCLRKDIDKFRYIVREKTIDFKPLENFPRSIPKRIQNKIKHVQSKGLFDQYWVLFNNLAKEEKKTTAQKIREKDPILFGKFKYDLEDRFFYVTDWVDEHCDLTLDKFITELDKAKVGEEYGVKKLPNKISDKELEQIKKDVLDRQKAIESTNTRNYRTLAAEQEAKAKAKRRKPWWARIFGA